MRGLLLGMQQLLPAQATVHSDLALSRTPAQLRKDISNQTIGTWSDGNGRNSQVTQSCCICRESRLSCALDNGRCMCHAIVQLGPAVYKLVKQAITQSSDHSTLAIFHALDRSYPANMLSVTVAGDTIIQFAVPTTRW